MSSSSDLSNDFIFEEFITQRSEDDPVELRSVIGDLEERCGEAGIDIERHQDFTGGEFIEVLIPCERGTRSILLRDLEDYQALLSIEFEKFVFLKRLNAICSYGDGSIEAGIRSLTRLPSRFVLRRLLDIGARDHDLDEEDFEMVVNQKPGKDDGVVIRLGYSSSEFGILSSPRPSRRRHRQLSITVSGASISKHDDAKSLLEKLADSFLMQIDLTYNLPLSLQRYSERKPFRGRLHPKRERTELEFPQYEFDPSPIALYTYARSAAGMPLLQFLAFYQTIEYHFPIYSEADARRKIRNILKDPAFRPNKNSDIARVLNVIRASGPRGFGDERSQLRSVLLECVDPGELREFLTVSDEREKFFTSKTRGLTDHKLPINNTDADLRNDTADRIYEIRNKIVHTKSGGRNGEVELLLPFSPEAELLIYDIDLIQFIARQVLIASSSPIKL